MELIDATPEYYDSDEDQLSFLYLLLFGFISINCLVTDLITFEVGTIVDGGTNSRVLATSIGNLIGSRPFRGRYFRNSHRTKLVDAQSGGVIKRNGWD